MHSRLAMFDKSQMTPACRKGSGSISAMIVTIERTKY